MTTNTRLKEFSSQLVAAYQEIEDQKVIAKAVLEAAGKEGIDVKALSKASKEAVMNAQKRAEKYAAEESLDLMRSQLDLFPADQHARAA